MDEPVGLHFDPQDSGDGCIRGRHGILFEALFAWSEPLIGAIEGLTAALQGGITAVMPRGLCVGSWSTASSPV